MKLTTIWRAMRLAENLRAIEHKRWYNGPMKWPLPQEYVKRRRQVNKFALYLHKHLEVIDNEQQR